MAKIMIAEDSPTEQKLLCQLLESQGYQLITAANGEEAIAQIEQNKPDMLILDVIMPKKNGFQVCRQLKKNPQTTDIKILMLTSKDQQSDRYWGTKQGADLYVTKPWDDEQLLTQIKGLL